MPRQTTTQPGVSFSPMVGVYETLHINDYTQEEIEDCWYSPDEKDLIRSEVRNTVMSMMQFNPNYNSNTTCPRGLEGIADGVERVLQRNKSIGIVLDIQQSSKQCIMSEESSNNISDHDLDLIIATHYKQHTIESTEFAKIMGIMDQEFVKIMNNTNEIIKGNEDDHDDDDKMYALLFTTKGWIESRTTNTRPTTNDGYHRSIIGRRRCCCRSVSSTAA